MTGRAGKFHEDLEAYIEYRKNCDHVTLSPEEVNFEDFLAFLDIEHYLGLRGSDTWSVDGNETQVVVKTLIGQILANAMPGVDAVPELYRRFAAALQPDDYVLTFNYDVLLERALESVGRSFRLFPKRYLNVRQHHAEVDSSREDVVVLKLHGSIDWFDRTQHSQLAAEWASQGFNSQPEDPVFSNAEALDVVPLIDGPRFPDDSLREMHRVRRLDRLYERPVLFHSTPWLLNPSSMKLLYSRTLRDFWYGLGNAGTLNLGLAIIGFSLPDQDEYARQVLYRLVRNYQNAYWNEDVLGSGLQKTPLIIVDHKQSDEDLAAFQSRYAFVDWEKTKTYMNGFDDKALELLFGT